MIRAAGKSARRARRAGASALDRATAGAIRGRAAARAARQAAREGASPRQAATAARAALKDAHRTTPVHGVWRRTLGAAAWGVGGWAIGCGVSMIRRLRNRFRLRPTGPNAAAAAARPERHRIGTKVNRPSHPFAGAESSGGTADMAGNGGGAPAWLYSAEQFANDLRTYEPAPGPGGMYAFYRQMEAFPDAFEMIATALTDFARRAQEDMPLNPAIGDLIANMAQAQAKIAEVGGQIKPAIGKLHAYDVERHEDPRPNESTWNV